MSRLSIIFILLSTIGGAATGIQFLVFPHMQKVQLEQEARALRLGAGLLREMDAADEGSLMRKALQLASREGLNQLFRRPRSEFGGAKEWRKALLNELDAMLTSAEEVAPGRVKPVIQDFLILDTEGKGLARNIDPLWMGKEP